MEIKIHANGLDFGLTDFEATELLETLTQSHAPQYPWRNALEMALRQAHGRCERKRQLGEMVRSLNPEEKRLVYAMLHDNLHGED